MRGGSEGAVEAQKVWAALPLSERKKFFDAWAANRDAKAQKLALIPHWRCRRTRAC